MKKSMRLDHAFVDRFPEMLQEGMLYISIPSGAIGHKCCCGCGEEVIISLTPTSWRFTFDGDNVSVWPSIGSHSLPCRSHYIIEKSEIRWCRSWSDEEVRHGREDETKRAIDYYDCKSRPDSSMPPESVGDSPEQKQRSPKKPAKGIWSKVKGLFSK